MIKLATFYSIILLIVNNVHSQDFSNMEILKKTINNLERIDHVSYISEFKATISNKVYLDYIF